MDCIFCKLVKGEIPCAKVYEDENCIAFLDIGPATPKGGHTLVVPKKHCETLKDVSEDELNAVMKVVKKLSVALMKDAEGVNVIQNNGQAAGQVVPHLHFHLMPRYENDGVKIAEWSQHSYAEGEIEKVQQRIKSLLNIQ